MLQPQSLGDPIRSSALQSHLPGAKLKGDKNKNPGTKKKSTKKKSLSARQPSQPANRVIYQEITTKLKFSHLQNSSSSRSIIDMASSSTYSRTSPENGREVQPDMNLGLYLCGCGCVCASVCLSVCLSIYQAINRSVLCIYKTERSTRDKAWSTSNRQSSQCWCWRWYSSELEKMQLQTSVSVLLLQLQSSSSFFATSFAICLFVCFLSAP